MKALSSKITDLRLLQSGRKITSAQTNLAVPEVRVFNKILESTLLKEPEWVERIEKKEALKSFAEGSL